MPQRLRPLPPRLARRPLPHGHRSSTLGPNPSAEPAAAAPPAAQARPHRPRPKPTNLQVLPKDFTGDQVIDVMHKFEDQLGVECDYCHAKNPTPSPTTGHLDFASDANPMKDRARIMMRMSDEINQTFLTQLTTPPAGQQVSCGTCHRGNAKPPAFVPAPEEPSSARPASRRRRSQAVSQSARDRATPTRDCLYHALGTLRGLRLN